METTITITTIHKPIFIEGLCENINEYSHKDVDILIIGDFKTPPIKEYCKQVSKKFNVPIQYLGIGEQIKELPPHPPILEVIIPYNSPDRIILGGLIAYSRGCERLIAVDDDNFVTDSDFVGYHKITGVYKELDLISNDLGWFNVHAALDDIHNIPFYPRGYPWSKRISDSYIANWQKKKVKIVVNQGLVLDDPDIDAITRLANPIEAHRMNFDFPAQFGLYKTWSPFNYQNTCLCRDLIPCYFRPRSGLRNADIWTAYIFNRLAEHLGDVISFGQPLAKQIRNEHNLFDDLEVELENNKETDYFIELLKEINLTGESYFSALTELLQKAEVGDRYPMAKEFIKEYQTWVSIVGEII